MTHWGENKWALSMALEKKKIKRKEKKGRNNEENTQGFTDVKFEVKSQPGFQTVAMPDIIDKLLSSLGWI